jgi:hypothetical protein
MVKYYMSGVIRNDIFQDYLKTFMDQDPNICIKIQIPVRIQQQD